ncbi:MAG: hypothetical protein OHK0022_14940 [Roseiflexaceae bacterium]
MPTPSTHGALRHHGHAVVIGASMAGLLAARVLSEHFARVTLLERDAPGEQPGDRKGVPQARHPHALLVRGQRELEGLFPGLTAQLRALGAEEANLGLAVRYFLYSGERIPYESIYTMLCVSRPLLEHTVRQRVLALPNVTLQARTQVLDLVAEAGAVRGVRQRPVGDHQLGEPSVLAADLVLDASGRNSRAPEWLAALGYQPPAEVLVDAGVGYTSRVYRRPADAPRDTKLVMLQPHAPHGTRGAIMTTLEGDRWHLTLVGMAGDHAPTDEAGFQAYLRSLPCGLFGQLLRDAEPLTPIVGYRVANRERRYSELPRYLEGFVVMGDAVMALNPIYGQGMSVAAVSAATLAECLQEQEGDTLAGLAQRFQTRLAGATAGAWHAAAGEDQRWIDLRAGRAADPATALMQRYMGQLVQATLTMPAVSDAFYGVIQMVTPPTELFRPDVVLQVMSTLPAVESPALPHAQVEQVAVLPAAAD